MEKLVDKCLDRKKRGRASERERERQRERDIQRERERDRDRGGGGGVRYVHVHTDFIYFKDLPFVLWYRFVTLLCYKSTPKNNTPHRI